MKIRRVDFSPDEFIAGTLGMTHAERGLYWQVCALIYSSCGGIPSDDERLFRGSPDNPRTTRALLVRLIEKGKIEQDSDSRLMVARCRKELESASKRISRAIEGGVKSGEVRLNGSRIETRVEEKQEDGLKVVQSKIEPSPSPSPKKKKDYSFEGFEEWWVAFPNKVAKPEALKAYVGAREKATSAELLTGIEAYKRTKPPWQDWSHPASWLNKERWKDKPAPSSPKPKNDFFGL